MKKQDQSFAQIMEKEKLEAEKIENEIKELDLKHKVSQNSQAVHSSNEEWEDIDSDSD